MRIAMVTTEFPRFSQTFIASKFLGLLQRGLDVHVVAERCDPDQWALFPQLREVADLRDRVHVASGDVEAALREIRPELAHFEFTFLANRWRQVKAAVGCKLMVSVRAYEPSIVRLDAPDPYRELWQEADALHLLNYDLWNRVRARGCPPDKPRIIIPPAINTEVFDPGGPKALAAVGTKERPFRILSVGRLHWHKGYDYALAAVARLVRAGIACEYRIIGDGELKPAVLFTLADLKLGSAVRLLGVQPRAEVLENMRWADVFLHAAVSEGFGNSPIEAQAMSLPVVCTDAGGLPENVADAQSGFVVPRRDATALAERLRRLAVDPALRRRMGQAGRQRVLARFRIEDQVGEFERAYRQVMSQSGGLVGSPAGGGAANGPPGPLAPAERERQAQVERTLAALEETLESHQRESDKLAARIEKLATRARQEKARLTAELERLGGELPAGGAEVRQRYPDLLRELVRARLPGDALLLVVSRGDEELLALNSRRGWHFPRGPAGVYAGYYPADSRDAIAHLEELASAGCDYLIFPAPAFWWLDHYAELRRYLETRLTLVHRDEHAVIYALRPLRERAGGLAAAAQPARSSP